MVSDSRKGGGKKIVLCRGRHLKDCSVMFKMSWAKVVFHHNE